MSEHIIRYEYDEKKAAMIGADGGDWCLYASAQAHFTEQAERIKALESALTEVDGCFEAALIEGWTEAMADGDMERIRDLYNRRIGYAREAAIRATQAAGYGEEG